jgi:hypothetical protein
MGARVRIECDFEQDPSRMFAWSHMERCDIYSPYDPARVEVIRQISYRKWVADRKCWRIPSVSLGAAIKLLNEFGDSVTVHYLCGTTQEHAPGSRQEKTQSKTQSASNKGWAMELLSACSPQLADNVYRQLSRALHPDVGGDEVLMKELNMARDALKGRK